MIIHDFETKYISKQTVVLEKDRYINGRMALIVRSEAGELLMMASVNLPDTPLEDNEIAIKNYSENTGVLQVLIKAGVVSEPLRWYRSGFVQIPVCRLLI